MADKATRFELCLHIRYIPWANTRSKLDQVVNRLWRATVGARYGANTVLTDGDITAIVEAIKAS